jgi:uncharacterized protein YndB with AHSA1/START domain
MPHATREIIIDRPPQVVFSYLEDAENDPAWRPGVIELRRVSGEGVGTRYRQVVAGPGGQHIDADFEITEHDPPWRLAFQTTAGPVRPSGSYELEAIEGATRLRFTLNAQLGGLKKAMSPMVQRALTDEASHLDNLKRVLEGDPPQ